jgi:hypothetical protein
MLNSENRPQFPPLSRVLLIESRYGTRIESAKALRETHLFEEIVEPISLADGMDRLASEDFDACVVGSSVHRDRAAEFIDYAEDASRSKDCALIVLAKDGDETIVMPGAHQVLNWPCSGNELTQGLVLGVINANPESPWSTVLLHSQTHKTAPQKKETVIYESPEQGLSAMFGGQIVDLEEIVAAVARGELGLDSTLRPDREAQLALSRVIRQIFSPDLRSRKILEFKAYFAAALEIWFIDVVRQSPEIATSNLRSSLLGYTAD